MGSFMRGAKLGAGLIGLGYGVYRMSHGKHDWVTDATVTAGISMTMTGLRREPIPDLPGRVLQVVRAFR